MTADVAQSTHTCSLCGAAREQERLPRGWKRDGDEIVCASCCTEHWHTRAITLRIDRVLDPPLDEGESFFARFTRAWRLSTDLANWAQRELLTHDVIRTPSMTTLPKYRAWNLYGEFTRAYPDRPLWDGAAGSASAILQAVVLRWRFGRAHGSRYSVLWRGDSSAAHYRWPYPWIVRAAETTLGWIDTPGGRVPTIRVSLPGGRQTFSLVVSREYRRPLRDFDALVRGAAVLGDTKILGRFVCGKLTAVMVRITGRWRRKPVDATGRTAVIRTAPECLLTVEVPDRDTPWRLHMLDLRGLAAMIAQRDDSLMAIREDLKHEKRWPRKTRARIVRADEPRAARFHRTIDTKIKQAAHQSVMFARRQHCDQVRYDDSCRSWLPRFQWAALRGAVANACAKAGIAFTADDNGASEDE